MSSMSGYMLLTGSPFLQDIRKQRKLEKEAATAAEAERQNAGRRAMMLGVDTGDVAGERPGIGRTITASTKGSTESEETLLKRGLNYFGHRRKKKSKDMRQENGSAPSRFDLLSFRPSSPMFGLRSQSPIPQDGRPTSPVPSTISLRVVSPTPGERAPETRSSLESFPSVNSSLIYHVDTPEPKTNLSATDILFGGRESIPPPPPPKPYVAAVIPNPKEDPIMSSLSPATIVKPKTPVPGQGNPVSVSRSRPPPLHTQSEPTFSSIPPPIERPIPPRSEDSEQDRHRKGSDSSDLDVEKDKKRQHWLVPSSPHTNIINEKLYCDLPLDTTDMPIDQAPSTSAPRPEKDPSIFAPRPAPEESGEFPTDYPPPPPFEEEETVFKPIFSEDLKAHLRGSDRAGQWWRLYAPPPELSFIPENTAVEIVNLYNEEQLEFDIKRIQTLAPAQPSAESSTGSSKTKRNDVGEELSVSVEEVGYNSHRASTHTAEGTIFSRRSISTTATSVSDAGAPESTSPVSPTQPSAASMARWTAFSKWGPANRDSLPAYSPMRDSFLGAINSRKNDNSCAMCMEDLTARRTTAIDCSHKYCNGCLRSIILASLNDEIAFPPKCCTSRVPVRAIKAVCNLSEQAALNHKIREYSQPPEDRVYCPTETCRRFVPPESVNDFRTKCLVCQFCQAKVCPNCKGRAHFDGNTCPKDEDLCFGCGATGGVPCLCRFEEDKFMDWGKTRMYESASDDTDDRIEEMTVHSAMADIIAYERKATREQYAQEEARRMRKDKEKMEKKRKDEARMTDLSKKYDKLTKQLDYLLNAQFELMGARLAAARAALLKKHEEGEAKIDDLLMEQDDTFETRVSERSVELDLQKEAELKILDSKFEEEEDDIIVVLSRQHRGKPNRDERIDAAVDRLKVRQREEREDLKRSYSVQFADIRNKVLADIEDFKQQIIRQRDVELESQYEEWHEAARREYADEQWFAAVKEIRKEHLAIQFEAQKDEYRRKKLEADLEESFKLSMMLQLEDERDKVYSSGRPREHIHIKMPMI